MGTNEDDESKSSTKDFLEEKVISEWKGILRAVVVWAALAAGVYLGYNYAYGPVGRVVGSTRETKMTLRNLLDNSKSAKYKKATERERMRKNIPKYTFTENDLGKLVTIESSIRYCGNERTRGHPSGYHVISLYSGNVIPMGTGNEEVINFLKEISNKCFVRYDIKLYGSLQLNSNGKVYFDVSGVKNTGASLTFNK